MPNDSRNKSDDAEANEAREPDNESLQTLSGAVAVPEKEQPNGSKEQELDAPPDGGYGWVCVACVFLINGHTWGLNSVRRSFFPE